MTDETMIVELASFERESIADAIREKREKGEKFTVIDVGGSASGWARGVVDAVADKFAPSDIGDVEFFEVDLLERATWVPILEKVERDGKFSFSVCSHVLEDLESFLPAVEFLEAVSESGIVMVPSKHREMSRFEGAYLGYIHHRWIFDAEDGGKFVAYPKIVLLEHMDASKVASNDPEKFELRAWWSGKIDVRRANDGYLGPTGDHVVAMYNKLLEL